VPALQNKPAEIRVPGEIADVLAHVGRVDPHALARTVRRRERDLVEHALHHGLQPARANVLDVGVHLNGDVRDSEFLLPGGTWEVVVHSADPQQHGSWREGEAPYALAARSVVVLAAAGHGLRL